MDLRAHVHGTTADVPAGREARTSWVQRWWGGGSIRRSRQRVTAAGASAVLLGALVVAVPVAVAPVAAAATTNDLKVSVVSARTVDAVHRPAGAVTKGDPVPAFKYMINVDNSGTADPSGSPQVGSGCSPEDAEYPASCQWPSINQVPGAAPIYRQGDETDFAAGAALADLPDGRYLISTLADGYKIDGAHFTVPMEGDGTVTVAMQPTPLPDSTLRAQVYLDEATTNMAIDNGEPGLAGFQGHVNDTLGEVTTDVYGNPLCTTYVGENADYEIPWNSASRDADGLPIVKTIGGKCFSDATGMLVMPHLGTNRYTTTVSPPDGSSYIQTTTLEGNHDWDTWLMEGATGYDTESTVAGEPVPTPQFGFVDASAAAHPALTGSGTVKGVVVAVKQYYPPTGGSFNYYLGMTGSKLDKPMPNPVLSLNDLENGDQAVWVGRGGADGSFTIPNVPDGNYSLSWWDEPQNYILQIVNVTVANGETVDLKQLPLTGWWTQLSGHVFNDLNGNGRRDTGEPGIGNFPLTLRKNDNSLMDRGSNAVSSDNTGFYSFDGAYPLSEWTVLEAYSDSFHTTGVTYQTDNQPTPTTIKGAGVDLSTLNIIGLSATVDWGVQPYARGTNGGIVGSISYDTTRNELDPRYAASEDWQPGIPNIPVELHATIDCGTDAGVPCDASDTYELAPDGAYKQGRLLNTYVSEHWSRPTGCTARDVDGTVLTHPGDEDVLVTNQTTDGECIAALVQGMQIGSYATDQGTANANFGATVDGNYGFGDACYDPNILDATDPGAPTCVDGAGSDAWEPLQGAYEYLVTVKIPDDASGKPMYKATGEEDINIGHGDQIVPQVPPSACAGPLHTVDVAGIGADTPYPPVVGDGTNGAPTGVTVPESTPVDNPTFVDIGGSPYESMTKPTCDTKLVQLNNGKSVVPMFNLFTEVPIPSRLRGLIVDDLNFSTDKRTTLYGDKAGLPNAPVGIYDYSNRLVYTSHSDFNGFYDVLMPSTDHINCPTPSGVCTNVYRFVGNDPGIPGALNADYNPRFRTIATEFEAMPGVTIPTDLAPTQVGVSIGTPGTLQNVAVSCPVNPVAPQVFAVDKAVVPSTATGAARAVTVKGLGFGATKGTGTIKLGTTVLVTTAWTDTQITATVPAVGTTTTTIPAGPLALTVTADNGKKSVNGLTVHVLGGTGTAAYTPTVYDVGPGVSNPKFDPTKTASHTGTAGVSHAIQNALDLAATHIGNEIVVVHPNTATTGNPRGAYYENLVVSTAVKLQGLGAGGFQGPNPNSPYVAGTILDGGAFGGDTDLATDWFTKVGAMTWVGNQTVSDGAVVYLLAPSTGTYGNTATAFTPAIDGFDIRGGDQQGFPGNINDLTGMPTGLPANIITQGGAIFANAYVRKLQVTNNVVQNNGGGYGTIRIGTPELAAPATNQHNEGVRIADNRIVQNAGTNLAGAIGLFAGSDGYEVARNDICGNFSLEYGAGVSVYGSSPGGKIHHNRITLNNSNDEGGGIMVAGQLPATPGTLSPGTGAVDIYANLIQGNLANDDGGGIRFLMAGNFPMNVYDNMIVNNVSTHEGGGIGINDAPNVRIYNNTIMKNLTTATAVTSNGTAAPAGVSTSANSDPLQATLPAGSPSFSNPLLFNNILWDNRAGTRAGTTVHGLGLTGDTTAVDHWDVGVADATGQLAPTSSVIQQNATQRAYTSSATNKTTDPMVLSPFDLSVSFATWRQNPAFVDATVVAFEKPADQMGDYHLQPCAGTATPACDTGAATAGGVAAPTVDIDGETRPSGAGYDIGADEFVGAAPVIPEARFFFSTAGRANPPGVTGTPDNSDIYRWNGNGFTRSLDATQAETDLRNNANVDGFSRVDKDHFYMSFTDNTTVPGLGTVEDVDVVYWNLDRWVLYFDGSAHGMRAGTAQDVNAISVQGGNLFFATFGNANPPGVKGTADDADIYRWNGTNFARIFDASTQGVPTKARVNGFSRYNNNHFLLSFSTDTTLPTVGFFQDEDIVEYTSGAWSLWFDGTAPGLTTSALAIDAFSRPQEADAPSPAALAAAVAAGKAAKKAQR